MKRKRLEKGKLKVGHEPGTLIHIGEKKVKIVEYNSEKIIEKELNSVDECLAFKNQPGTNLWINVDGLDQIEIIAKLGNYFDIHPLILEDILNTEQRPKMEDYESYAYMVFKVMFFDILKKEIVIDQVSIILGYNYILSFQEREISIFDPLRNRLKNSFSRLRKNGVDYLAYSLIDSAIDNYFLILEQLGEEIEDLEEELIIHPVPETLKTIHKYKRDMIILRKSVWPLRELISGMQQIESKIIKATTRIYLRDIYDHTVRVIETIEDFRDILSSMVDIHLSSVSNRMNEIMKVLTVVATIFIPLTFIVGIYGMNFEYMPELHWRWGYPAVMLFMASLGISMLIYFKKKRWI